MLKICNWLKRWRSPDEQATPADQPGDGRLIRAVEMPDIYGDYEITVPDLKVLSASSTNVDDSEGYDPYDTTVVIEK